MRFLLSFWPGGGWSHGETPRPRTTEEPKQAAGLLRAGTAPTSSGRAASPIFVRGLLTKTGTDSLWAPSVFSSIPNNSSLPICLFPCCFHFSRCAALGRGKDNARGRAREQRGPALPWSWPRAACCPLHRSTWGWAAAGTRESHSSSAPAEGKILTFSMSPATRPLVLPTVVERETQIL